MDPGQQAKWQLFRQCWSSGHWERMERLGRELLLASPREADLLCGVGVALFQQDNFEEARRFFEDALGNEPDHAGSHRWMGWYWARRKKFPQAEECLRRALAISPGNDSWWIDLGRVFFMQGDGEGSRWCAEKALAVDPGNVNAIALLTESDLAAEGMGRRPPGVLRERLEVALSQEPENANLHETLGEVFENAGRMREAEERYREALALDPGRPWLWRKVRRMGLKRDWVDRALSLLWNIGLWFVAERQVITIVIGLVFCTGWALAFGPISFLYRLLFRVELEFLAARGTREGTISAGRRVLRFAFLTIAAGFYWGFVWWLVRQSWVWPVVGWAGCILVFGVVGCGICFAWRGSIEGSRHRKTIQELEAGGPCQPAKK